MDYDRIASEYARHRQVHPGVLRSLIQTSGIGPVSNILEVGCGTGNYIAALERGVGCSCWGIDPSEEMLSVARQRSENVHYQPGIAEKIDFAGDSFHFVFSVDVIHHVSNRPAYFREVFRLLRMGGRVCTVTDSEWIIRHRQPLAIYFPETVEADVRRYPSVSGLRRIMEDAGFIEIAEETVEFSYPLTDIQPYREKAFSCLHLISDHAFQKGIERMENDLRAGPIQSVSRYLLLWGKKECEGEGVTG